MRMLLILLSYAKANEMVARHWPWYLQADADIMGVGRQDSDTQFPEARLVWTVDIGKDEYVNGANLPDLHVRALSCGLSLTYRDPDMEDEQPYTHFCLTEPDALFFKPPPLHRDGLMATYSGGNSPGFLGTAFFHGPWYFDRDTADKAVEFGRRMIDRGLIERGFPDRFWGLFCDLYGVKFTPFGKGTYSRNRLDRPEYIKEARQAIKDGIFYLHGVKTKEEMDAVLKEA